MIKSTKYNNDAFKSYILEKNVYGFAKMISNFRSCSQNLDVIDPIF